MLEEVDVDERMTWNVTMRKRLEYFNHLVARWALEGPTYYGPDGRARLTGARLRAARERILADSRLWLDVVRRHGGIECTPEELEENDPPTYEHMRGNFWGQVQTFIRW